FWFTGAIGALWLAGWALLSRGEALPAHPQAAKTVEHKPTMRWLDREVWALIVAYSMGAFPLGFVLYQSSLYLSAVLHRSQADLGRVLWIPPLGWETGYFFWGWVVDRFAKAGADLSAIRRQFVLLGFLSLPLAATPLFSSEAITLALMFLGMFVT